MGSQLAIFSRYAFTPSFAIGAEVRPAFTGA
jgi:hypothetical protein